MNYGDTSFSNIYNKKLVADVDGGMSEFSIAYLLQSPTVYSVQPFVTLGPGLVVFSPKSSVSPIGIHASSQLLPAFVYGVGLNYPLFSTRFGLRLQYRGLKYKTPSYQQVLLDSHTLRSTMEPSFGVYYRF